MAFSGIFTTLGISKTIEAQNNEGFKIFPESFSVSRDFGVLANSRTTQNAGTWFSTNISSRTVVDQNTIKLICTIPPESSLVKEDVREVCIFAKDINGDPFLLAVGQTTEQLIYDPTGTVTLELQLSLADTDLTSTYVFKNTKAAELAEHATDPNAHPEIAAILAQHGIFIPTGAYAFARMGQNVEYPVQFDGTKATFTHAGVTWTATYNGTELNTLQITFDGVKTNDEIRADFNAANYPNTIEHNGIGSVVSSATIKTLSGGTYLVDENDIVYKDTDGVFKQALADGTAKSRIAGAALLAKKTLVGAGFVDINTGYASNTPLYLSGTLAGKITNFNTNVSVGVGLGSFIYFTGYAGDVSATVTQNFDAIVTTAVGAGQFSKTQDAINYVPDNGRILIAKIEDVKETINTMGKSLNFVFDGADTGWRKFLGQPTIFKMNFSTVPTQGTFRMEYLGQESNDLPYNASAAQVQTEFNLFSGHNGFTVTGNFATGFTFTSNDFQIYTAPTFAFAGLNEIQRFDFSNVPNDGTVTFDFNGQNTLNFPWDDSETELQAAFDALSTIQNVLVTGSYALGYQVEFQGGWLEDGHKEQNLIEVIATDLDLNGTVTNINGSTVLPIEAAVVQKGKTPASNLYTGTTPVVISTVVTQEGEEEGEDRLMNVDSPIMNITGLGQMEGFKEGLVLDNANTILALQCRVIDVDLPVSSKDKLATVNYDIEIPNYAKDVFAQLRLSEHPANGKRAIVQGMDFILPNGVTLVKSFEGLKAKFEGAQIDFALGKVFGADGVTDLDQDFTPPTITSAMWKWFSVSLVADGQDNTVNQTLSKIVISEGPTEGATKEAAPTGEIFGTPVGMVALRGALGEKEKTEITTGRDFFGSLKGKGLVLTHPVESVSFWFSDESLDTFSVKKENLVTGSNSDLFASTQTKVLAAKIVLSSTTTIDTLYLWLKKVGAPTGYFGVRLLGSTGGAPDLGNVIAVGSNIQAVDVPLDFAIPMKSAFTEQVIPAGTYFIEVNAETVVLPSGASVAIHTDASGSTDIYNRADADSSFLTTLGNRIAHVALVDRIKGYPAIALTATRHVEITTLNENDFQATVAQKLQAAIDGDSLFTASVAGNKVLVENSILGAVADADMGTTGFFKKVITQGTNTDATGIDDVKNENILQLGGNAQGPVGPRGEKGERGTAPFLESMLYRFYDSFFNRISPVIFGLGDGPANVHASTTATYDEDEDKDCYFFEAGQFILSKNLFSVPSLAQDFQTKMVELHAKWKDGAIDLNAVYEIALDGINFNTITMDRHGESGTFYGRLDIPTPPTAILYNAVAGSAVELGSVSNTTATHTFSVTDKMRVKEIKFQLNKIGSPDGYYTVKLLRGSAIIFQKNYFNSGLGAGLNTLTITDAQNILPADDYSLVIETSDSYKATYAAGTKAIAHNGYFQINGHVYDLRLKITASANDTKLEGFGLFHEETIMGFATDTPPTRELFSFSGDDDVTDFTVNMFTPDPQRLKIYDETSGQVYYGGAFTILGNVVTFPDGTFLVAGQTIKLLFEQL